MERNLYFDLGLDRAMDLIIDDEFMEKGFTKD